MKKNLKIGVSNRDQIDEAKGKNKIEGVGLNPKFKKKE